MADYSQIELRVAALIAKEQVMLEGFKCGKDLQRAIAATNLRKRPGEITKEERATGKVTNFGFIYGQSAGGFVCYERDQLTRRLLHPGRAGTKSIPVGIILSRSHNKLMWIDKATDQR